MTGEEQIPSGNAGGSDAPANSNQAQLDYLKNTDPEMYEAMMLSLAEAAPPQKPQEEEKQDQAQAAKDTNNDVNMT